MRRALTPDFSAVDGAARLALAVSGGSDSLALLYLAHDWAAARGVALEVLTVDHRLRPESAAEAAFVAQRCAALGAPHRRLVWSGPPVRGNLAEAAREARYRLMAAACAESGAEALLTGHTLDDQAETVLMRLARGSGVDGLAAMAPQTRLWGLRVVRPLLGASRADLRAALRARGERWVEDPTNDDAAHDRVKARRALAALAPLGLGPERLAGAARMMALARDALEAGADSLLREGARAGPPGWVALDCAAFAAAPLETALRAAARVLAHVSGAPRRPRLASLEPLVHWLRGAPEGGGRSLGGALWIPARGGRMVVAREPAACAPPAPVMESADWDGRFRARLEPPQAGLTLGACGEAGLAALAEALAEFGAEAEPAWRAAPRAARLSAPAVWGGGALLCAPHAGWRAPEAGFRVALASIAPELTGVG